jgi:hypothetical protein
MRLSVATFQCSFITIEKLDPISSNLKSKNQQQKTKGGKWS